MDFPQSEAENWMAGMGLPTQFNAGLQQPDVKGSKKRTYYCDICLTELNSDDTLRSHANGQKHLKKINAANLKKVREGADVIVDPNTYIRTCAPTKSAPKKIPIRLGTKLAETRYSIV